MWTFFHDQIFMSPEWKCLLNRKAPKDDWGQFHCIWVKKIKKKKKKESGLRSRRSAKYTPNGDDLVAAPHNQPHPHPNPHPLPSWVTCLRSSSRILSTINKTINTIVWISCSIRDEISDVTNTRACVYFPVQVVFFAQFSLCVNVYINNMIIKRRVWSD